MSACSACLRRAFQNLALDRPSPSQSHTLSNGTSARPQIRLSSPWNRGFSDGCITRVSKRHHATYESLAKGHHRRILRKALQTNEIPPPNRRRKSPGALTKGEIRDSIARNNNRTHLSKDVGGSSVDSADDRRKQFKLKKDIETYYKDPLQLANVVQRELRVPDYQAAVNLVRASEGIVFNNTVSWNHLIDFSMSQGETDQAWKVFNEMKKRGHKPDAHTYTIMLRGYSLNAKKTKKGFGERAVGIYNSMFAPNSAVVPNTIHTNAVLNVCARSGDMDSLWAIAGKLPVSGAAAPDRWTFTTILNAIRDDATQKVAQLLRTRNEEHGDIAQQQKVIFEEALKDGRKLWADVSHRWRRADLVVDEPLVCAMGRLILGCGTSRDFEEIFDLVDSTMNIKLAERKVKDATVRSTSASPEDGSLEVGQTRKLTLDESNVYATPSNNTLGMIIEAAAGANKLKVGKGYWHMLTTPNGTYKIQPDVDNIISYLRLLRVSRASTDILELLSREWPDHIAEKLYKRGTFIIAMSTCIRDKNNQFAFENADKILTLMQQRLEEAELGVYNKVEAEDELPYKERMKRRKERMTVDETFGEEQGKADVARTKPGVESLPVDPKALRMYIELAMVTTPGWQEGLEGKDDGEEKFPREPKKNNTIRALKRIGPQMISIRRLAKMKIEEAELEKLPQPGQQQPFNRFTNRNSHAAQDRHKSHVGERLEDLIELLKTITSAYDRVIGMADRFEDESLKPLDPAMIDKFRETKRMVSGFLSRTKDEVGRVMSQKMEFNKWRTMKDKEEEDDHEHEDFESRTTSSGNSRGEEIPKIAKQVKQVYADTDRDLGRVQSRSRRQRNERVKGVEERMTRRLGRGRQSDIGVLNENLQIEDTDAVRARMEGRMAARALNIRFHRSGFDRATATAEARP